MYLDPGFGSMVIQMVVAGLAAAAAVLYIARNKIKNFFSKNKANTIDIVLKDDIETVEKTDDDNFLKREEDNNG